MGYNISILMLDIESRFLHFSIFAVSCLDSI